MNYSAMLKKEIAVLPQKECCRLAMLSAIIHTAGSIKLSDRGVGLIIKSESAVLLEFSAQLVNLIYGVDPVKMGKREVVFDEQESLNIFLDTGNLGYTDGYEATAGISPFVIMDDCCRTAYIKGAFLGAGSLSVKSNYHCEISVSNAVFAEQLCGLMEQKGVQCRSIARKDRYVVYVKGSENVCGFAALVGNGKTALRIMDLVVERMSSQMANRQTNCDMANLDRSINVSAKQLAAIKKAQGLKGKLAETAAARLKYPDYSYEELGKVLGISKSAVKYRLKQIMKICEGEEDGK